MNSNNLSSLSTPRKALFAFCRWIMVFVVLMTVVFFWLDPLLNGAPLSFYRCAGFVGKVGVIIFGTLAAFRREQRTRGQVNSGHDETANP